MSGNFYAGFIENRIKDYIHWMRASSRIINERFDKEDVTNYTFSRIKLPKKNVCAEDNESDYSYVDYEVPETKKEFQNVKTISDSATYEKEHNLQKLVLVNQSSGGNMSVSELVLSVNGLTSIILGVSYSDEAYKKELTSGIQENDFDI